MTTTQEFRDLFLALRDAPANSPHVTTHELAAPAALRTALCSGQNVDGPACLAALRRVATAVSTAVVDGESRYFSAENADRASNWASGVGNALYRHPAPELQEELDGCMDAVAAWFAQETGDPLGDVVKRNNFFHGHLVRYPAEQPLFADEGPELFVVFHAMEYPVELENAKALRVRRLLGDGYRQLSVRDAKYRRRNAIWSWSLGRIWFPRFTNNDNPYRRLLVDTELDLPEHRDNPTTISPHDLAAGAGNLIADINRFAGEGRNGVAPSAFWKMRAAPLTPQIVGSGGVPAEHVPLIPGVTYLGRAVNIFDARQEMSEHLLFDTTTAADTVVVDGKSLGRPANVTYNQKGQAAESHVETFEDRRAYEERTSRKYDVKVAYGAFSASFDRTFSSDAASESQFTYALATQRMETAELTFKDHAAAAVAPWVLENEDFQQLPMIYRPEDLPLFIRFFDTYGTHFVSEIVLGGELRYAAKVNKQFASSATDVKNSLNAEYGALFSASAQSSWSKVDKKWLEKRTTSLSVVGGDAASLSIVAPNAGETYGAQFKAWQSTIAANPGVVDFRLEEIGNIFSGQQRDAVQEALAAYLGASIRVTSGWGSSGVRVLGETCTPEEGVPTAPNLCVAPGSLARTACMVHVVVVHRPTLMVVLDRYYAPEGMFGDRSWANGMWARIAADLSFLHGGEHIVAFSTQNWLGQVRVSGDMRRILFECGASATEIGKWDACPCKNVIDASEARSAYSLIGIYGERHGRDRFSVAPAGAGLNWTEQRGGTGGSPFDDARGGIGLPARIESVKVWGNNVIEGLQAIYLTADNTRVDGTLRGRARDNARTVALGSNEHITRVWGRCGSYVDQIGFDIQDVVTKVRRSEKHGGGGGKEFTLDASGGAVAFWGRCGNHIDSIGVYVAAEPGQSVSADVFAALRATKSGRGYDLLFP